MARYAISDIHGCLVTFQKMVEEIIQLQPHDHLYLLGDYINKGPDSKGVLEYIFLLQRRGYWLTCLRGNHDQLLLDALNKGEHSIWLTKEDQRATLENFGVEQFANIPQPYLSFIKSLPLLVVLDDYVLAHAGVDFSLTNLLATDNHTLLNSKHIQPSAQKLAGRTLVHGHLPVPKASIEKTLRKNKGAINLDAGCVYYRNEEYGNLCALNLDTRKLFWLTNQEAPYPIKVKV